MARRGVVRHRRSSAAATVSNHEKAYFAGYTDAEGCVSIAAFTRGAACYWFAFVCFGQTQPTVVERLHSVYGGHMRVRKRGHRRRQKEVRLQGLGDVRRFLLDVLPHLREKRAQAEIVLNRFDPKADRATNQALLNRLVKLKAKRLASTAMSLIERRLSITPQAHLKCFDCADRAFARGFCAKHYQKAKREGRIATNPKGTGVPFTYIRALKEFEAPYFAGYFDGDGCIAIWADVGERHWYPRITFRQTQPDTLIELHSIYGGSLTVGKARGERRRPTLVYQLIQRAAVFALLRDMLPFLVEKRDQVEIFLARYRSDMGAAAGKQLKDRLSEMKRRSFGESSDLSSTVGL
jgi:hypothetical protein